MGNSSSSNAGGSNNYLFPTREYDSATCLIAAIQAKKASSVQKALETARKELAAFKKSSLSNTTDENYKKMLDGMHKYLTRKYDIGQGVFAKVSPIEFAESMEGGDAEEVLHILRTHLADVEKSLNALAPAGSSGRPGGIEKIDSERVLTAKERLMSFRSKEKPLGT